MKGIYLTLLLGVLLNAGNCYEMKAYTDSNWQGSVYSKSTAGSITGGPWNSYKWTGASLASYCVTLCNGSTNLGYRCNDYDNNNIRFTKFIISTSANSPGQC